MRLPVDPIAQVQHVVHLPDLIPGVLPVIQLTKGYAWVALHHPIKDVIDLPVIRYFNARAAGAVNL